MNSPVLKPGPESPPSSESGSNAPSVPALEDSSSKGELSGTENHEILEEILANQVQEVWNYEFLNRQNWLLAEANYRGLLRDWFKASCQLPGTAGQRDLTRRCKNKKTGRMYWTSSIIKPQF